MNARAPRIGHDLVDLPRFARALEKREASFKDRVFTPAEWETASSRRDRVAALAARFAAKEAVMKALRTGWGQGVRWLDIEVLGGGRTPPELVLHGEAARRAEQEGLEMQLSLSHAGEMASAVVLAYPRAQAE